ncbi:hypothetical protein PENTCL1PPCAC_8862, partial [Pristionchus entomophagus]
FAKLVNEVVKKFITCLSSSVNVGLPKRLFLNRYGNSPQCVESHSCRIEMVENVEIHRILCKYCFLLTSNCDSYPEPFFSKTGLCSQESRLQSMP